MPAKGIKDTGKNINTVTEIRHHFDDNHLKHQLLSMLTSPKTRIIDVPGSILLIRTKNYSQKFQLYSALFATFATL